MFHAAEISQGSFRVELGLPTSVASELSDARYDRGLLVLTLPKAGRGWRRRWSLNPRRRTLPRTPAIPDALPVLPLRGGTVVFPLAVVPLIVGQERSIRLIDDVMRGDRLVALVARRRTPETPGPDDLHRIGTAA